MHPFATAPSSYGRRAVIRHEAYGSPVSMADPAVGSPGWSKFMQASISSVASKRLALVAFTSMWLAACGGGGSGGDATAAAPSPAGSSAPVAAGLAAPASSPAVASGPVAAAPAPVAATSAPAVAAPTPAVAAPPAAGFTVQGTDGPDTLES